MLIKSLLRDKQQHVSCRFDIQSKRFLLDKGSATLKTHKKKLMDDKAVRLFVLKRAVTEHCVNNNGCEFRVNFFFTKSEYLITKLAQKFLKN